ncbi:hypothetical protein BDB00DRAFT_758674 [Zychaea mexicana]|uniref:uncharacterized protein n=1 Tax=Zychaea mexicana TaxID=64656 RepID=UPI0022FE7B6F|nr:uncharacterized protein BDB00DRAFT_758674 [Zychaea mexicana]KAI9496240.1 hypothetical protein BDB00DRAFT_758674 [Zychaea mexicana]
MAKKHPSYHQLPIDIKYPSHSAWGIWGDDDTIGTLNLLPTKDHIMETLGFTKNKQEGKLMFSLSWIPQRPNRHLFNRGHIPRTVRARADDIEIEHYDDIILSTVSPTEWHSLRSFACADDTYCRFYNGVPAAELASGRFATQPEITGRAVLLDYGRWRAAATEEYNPLLRTAITVDELHKVAQTQGIEDFSRGDILLLRTGWTAAYEIEARHANDTGFDLMKPQCPGIEASEDMFRWLWNCGFAALATDSFSFEAFPPKCDDGPSCHSRVIGGWGMTVGELFNLEEIAESSATDGVYEYYFTSGVENNKAQKATPFFNAVCIK